MWRLLNPLYGSQPVAEFYAPDTTQRHILGTMVTGVDPYWGAGEFIYGKAAGTQEMGSLTTPDTAWLFADVPNTANTGRPIYTAIYPMTVNQFGWYQCSGAMVLSATASVAADAAVGITAAGQVGINTAGKQVLGYFNKLPSTTTVVKTGKVTNGTSRIEITNGSFGGWFHNVTLSGTNIPASSEIVSFDADQRTLVMSELATPNSGIVTITGTYTGFVVGIGNSPHVQGAIT